MGTSEKDENLRDLGTTAGLWKEELPQGKAGNGADIGAAHLPNCSRFYTMIK
jgi:hypothetical protein